MIFLDKLLQPAVYYLIGEKGTGKTAYAAFLNNNDYSNCKSILKFISGTDYEKFHELKKKEHLDISGYVDIWKTILLLLLAKTITDNEKTLSIYNRNNHSKLMSAIDEYYNELKMSGLNNNTIFICPLLSLTFENNSVFNVQQAFAKPFIQSRYSSYGI